MVKQFYPRQIINLYDVSRDKSLRGELYITPRVPKVSIPFNGKLLKLWQLVYCDFNQFQNNFFEKLDKKSVGLKNIFSLKKIAYFCFFLSIFGFTTLLFPFIAGAIDSIMITDNKSVQEAQQVKRIENPNDLANYPFEVKAGQNEVIDNTFKIFIPKINLESDIVPNVDTTSEDIYKQKLQYGVAHANGSYFPGQKGPVFLFAHSTDTIARILEYNAKFFDVNKLEAGDSVQVHFRGKDYQYIITKKEIINPDDLELIRNSNANLILQTCWPLGTDWQRLVLYADLIEV